MSQLLVHHLQAFGLPAPVALGRLVRLQLARVQVLELLTAGTAAEVRVPGLDCDGAAPPMMPPPGPSLRLLAGYATGHHHGRRVGGQPARVELILECLCHGRRA